MSEETFTIEDHLHSAIKYSSSDVLAKIYRDWLAELATLRAKAEAWDAVANASYESAGLGTCSIEMPVWTEVNRQLDRLSNLTPARGEGKE